MGDKPGRLYPGDGPYYQQLRAAFDVKWSAQRTDVAPGDNTTVCTYPGLAAWVPFEDSVNGVVDFHKKVTFCCGLYDGLYMDSKPLLLYCTAAVLPTVHLTAPSRCDTRAQIR